MLGRANKKLGACHAVECPDPYLAECEKDLARQFEKLFYMDRYHIIIKDGWNGGLDEHIRMNEELLAKCAQFQTAEPAQVGDVDMARTGLTQSDLNDEPEPQSRMDDEPDPQSRKGGGEDEKRKGNDDASSEESWCIADATDPTGMHTAAASASGTAKSSGTATYRPIDVVPDMQMSDISWPSDAMDIVPIAQSTSAGSACLRTQPNPVSPVRIFVPHEVLSAADVAWTPPTGPDGWTTEQMSREMRNSMMKLQLLQSRPVQYKAAGSSVHPRIQDGSICVFEPVHERTEIIVGDVVFCQAQPRNIFVAHWVVRIDTTAGSAAMYHIGTTDGNLDGWCRKEHIYGKLCERMP